MTNGGRKYRYWSTAMIKRYNERTQAHDVEGRGLPATLQSNEDDDWPTFDEATRNKKRRITHTTREIRRENGEASTHPITNDSRDIKK